MEGEQSGVPVAVAEDHTEKVRLPARPPRSRLRLALVVSAAVTLLAGGALWAADQLAESESVSARRFEVEATAIASLLDGQVQAAQARAEALAASPVLRAAIETDAATLADMAGDDVRFPIAPGEVVEVQQISDAGRKTLLRVPATAAPIDPAAAARGLCARPDGLDVVAIASMPRRDSGISGSIAMSAPVDLIAIGRRLGAHAIRAELTGLPTAVVLASRGGAVEQRATFPIATTTAAVGTLALVVDLGAGPGRFRIARYLCWGVALLLLLAFGASLLVPRTVT